MKKLIIAGGTGFLGQALCRELTKEFDRIVVLSRSKHKQESNITYLTWDAETFGDWCRELEGATAVINLCGKSVDCRYTEKNKALIFSSRLNSTRLIAQAISQCNTPPLVWINGASATIYRHSETQKMTESSGEIGSGFSVEVCKAWEHLVEEAELPHTRKINLRLAMVLGTSGGVYPELMKVVKRGLGGTMGKGTQQMSWIHVSDFCRMVLWLINKPDAQGVYNCVAPMPVINKRLMQLLRKKAGRMFGLPASELLLTIGAFVIGTETELILKSRYAYPERALKEGFVFNFETIDQSLADF